MKDLREFIVKCESAGELVRVKSEVDWDLELSHIAKLSEERGGPALLFENVKRLHHDLSFGHDHGNAKRFKPGRDDARMGQANRPQDSPQVH
jgi:hypothetical protein